MKSRGLGPQAQRKNTMSRLRKLVAPQVAHATPGDNRFELVKLLVNGLSAAIIGLLLSRLLLGFTQILIVRALGPELNGEYQLLIASLTLLTSLLGLGIDTWLLHYASREPDRLGWYISQVLLVKFIGACVLLGYLAVVWSYERWGAAGLIIGGVGLIFDSVAQTGYSALRAIRRNGQVAAFQVIAPCILLAVLLITPAQSLTPTLLVTVLSASNVLMAVIMVFWILRAGGVKLVRQFALFNVVRSAWLFVLADVMSNAYTQVAVTMLGLLAGTAAVGFFSPARDLVVLTFLVPNLIFAVGLPLLNSRRDNPAERSQLLWAMSIGAAIYGLGVLAAFWLLGGMITTILYSSRYAAALPYLEIMSPIALAKAGSFVCVAVLIVHQKQRLRVFFQFVMLLVFVGGGFVVIPRYGATGAAWLSLATETLLFMCYFIAARLVLRQHRD